MSWTTSIRIDQCSCVMSSDPGAVPKVAEQRFGGFDWPGAAVGLAGGASGSLEARRSQIRGSPQTAAQCQSRELARQTLPVAYATTIRKPLCRAHMNGVVLI